MRIDCAKGQIIAIFFATRIALLPADGLGSPESPFLTTAANCALPIKTAPPGMVWISGGEFSMGSGVLSSGLCCAGGAMPDAEPVHRVYVNGFWMDQNDVTNEQFARFVKTTAYVTLAEQKPARADFPGVPLADLVAGSLVFTPAAYPVPWDDPAKWWRYQQGADWRHPEGPRSTIEGKEKYPVVQIALLTRSLTPNGHASGYQQRRNGNSRQGEKSYPKSLLLGRHDETERKVDANTWQGTFPVQEAGKDGFRASPLSRNFLQMDMISMTCQAIVRGLVPGGLLSSVGTPRRSCENPAGA